MSRNTDEVVEERNDAPPLTKGQRDELERRWLDYQANPDEGEPWEDVKKALLAE
jgi:putative addiction module component (TIGR02574 family)